MALKRRVAVIGGAIAASMDRRDRSLEELLYEVSQAALADAGLESTEVDGIVVGSNDQFDGRAISIMAASAPLGGVGKDIYSTPSSGEHAFVLGVLRIATGQFDTHLVVSWSPTEASSLSEAQRLGADPYFHRHLPLDELSTFALQATSLAAKVPECHDFATKIAHRNRENGERANPETSAAGKATSADRMLRWPITDSMVSEPTSGIVVLVLASEKFVADRGIANPAWINGMGWATEANFLGDRDLASAPALEEAAMAAYAEAGIENPREAFDLVEITGPSPYQELIAYDALGLSNQAQWSRDFAEKTFDRSGSIPMNPSGGVTNANPVFCTGLIRIAEAAAQIRGKAGHHQLTGVRNALAHAGSGFSMMYQTVVVLGAEPKGAAA